MSEKTTLERKVAGKAVVFRRQLTLANGGRELSRLLAADRDGSNSWDINIAIMQIVVESWGLEGDPSQATSYEGLDLFEHLAPLWAATQEYIADRIGKQQQTKN